MITVCILINGNPLIARAAHRRTIRHNKGKKYCYLLDDGTQIYHDPKDGPVELSIKMLKTIKFK